MKLNRLNYIKRYLIWASNQIKLSTGASKEYLETRCWDYFAINIRKVESVIEDYMKFHSDQLYSLRNRGGRSIEHVGSEPSKFDYGSFLEIGIDAHNCILVGSGSEFTSQELTKIIKDKKGDFIYYTVLSTFGFFHDTAKDIFNKAYNESANLFYQSINTVSFVTLKALVLFIKMSCYESDINLIKSVFPIVLRMAYCLGIDKIDLKADLQNKSKQEACLILKKYKLWAYILFIINADCMDFFDHDTLPKHISSEPIDMELLDQLENKYSSCNGRCMDKKRATSFIWFNSIDTFSIIYSPFKAVSNSVPNSERTCYNKLELIYNDSRQAQQAIKWHIQPNRNFIIEEHSRSSRKEPLCMQNYLCRFSDKFCIYHKFYLLVRYSILLYCNQIYLICPSLLNNTAQRQVSPKDILIVLEAALKIASIYKILIYVYFENIVGQLSETPDNIGLVSQIKTYLNNNVKPNTTDIVNKMIYSILKIIQFEELLNAFYVFLLAITCEKFQLQSNCPNEVMDFLKQNCISILELFQLAYNLERFTNKSDIDFVIQRVQILLFEFPICSDFRCTLLDCLNNKE
ncbi:hypothetical protein K502DRAFT_348056 [Neoconidiobolus thromboides FSU 785]|nr:hypothetical protein K502DRAFT_348056 [Neoconidiobolus thromboides FSU 785]